MWDWERNAIFFVTIFAYLILDFGMVILDFGKVIRPGPEFIS